MGTVEESGASMAVLPVAGQVILLLRDNLNFINRRAERRAAVLPRVRAARWRAAASRSPARLSSLWHRPLGRSASESGTLCPVARAHGRGARRRRRLMLATLFDHDHPLWQDRPTTAGALSAAREAGPAWGSGRADCFAVDDGT